MSYGLRYIREFTNRHDEHCRLEFWFKNYAGASQTIFGSRDSFVLSKELDDPFEPIQAQPAKVELLAESQISFSIDEFYSEDDEYILCKFYLAPAGGTERTAFLSGNANIQFGRTGNNNFIFLPEINGVTAGQQVTINDINYTIINVSTPGRGTTALQVLEPVTIGNLDDASYTIYNVIAEKLIYTGFVLQDETADAFIDYDHFIQLTITDNLGLLQDVSFGAACGTTDPYQTFTIAEYLQIILSATGLQLPIQIFANIYETATTTRAADPAATFVDQIRIKSAVFADDSGKWQSCYDILSAILKTFNCFICQRLGAWVVYRWGELKATDKAIFFGTQFNYDLTGKTAISLPNTPIIISENSLNVLIGGADNVLYKTRPYKYVKETFNYQQPGVLIKNLDLQQVGNLRGTSTVVRNNETITLKDYDAPYWWLDPVTSTLASINCFIRVETDSRGIELTRYLITTSTLNGQTDYVALSSGMYANKGDKISISATLRVPNDPGSSFYSFYVAVYDGLNRYWLSRGNDGHPDGQWVRTTQVPVRSDFNPAATNYTDWRSIDVDSMQLPIDGWINIRLGVNDNNGGETDWKDIKLTYTPYINESTQITGHTHTQTQDGIIKNNKEDEITLDDSPRNLIAGTLLTNELTHFTGFNSNWWYPNPIIEYVTRTQFWQRNQFESFRLGQITTQELKQVYSKLRYKLDCTFIWKDLIDNLTTFQLPVLPGANFRMAAISSINYADCTCKCVLIEVWQSGEIDVDADYEFRYLYQNS